MIILRFPLNFSWEHFDVGAWERSRLNPVWDLQSIWLGVELILFVLLEISAKADHSIHIVEINVQVIVLETNTFNELEGIWSEDNRIALSEYAPKSQMVIHEPHKVGINIPVTNIPPLQLGSIKDVTHLAIGDGQPDDGEGVQLPVDHDSQVFDLKDLKNHRCHPIPEHLQTILKTMQAHHFD